MKCCFLGRYCHGSKLNQPAMVEMTQPVDARIRSHEKRGIFLSNKPDINELMRACLEEKCRLTQILVAGSFRPLLAGL